MKSIRGFTLIELLVVIAIIGLLASIVLASLNSGRMKSRDARRIADLKQLQSAIELYGNDNAGLYPNSAIEADAATALSVLAPMYITIIPDDPLPGHQAYRYKSNAASNSTAYCVGTQVEGAPPSPATTCRATTMLSNVINYSIGN